MYGGPAATTTSTRVKRDAPGVGESAGQPLVKRIKAETEDPDEKIARLYETGGLSKVTRAVLKDFLDAHGLAAAGKKDDLVEQVEAYFERKHRSRPGRL